MAAWRAGPCAIQSNLIKLLEGECGEEMKSDHMWDLGTEGEQQRLLIPTAGVTAAYAETGPQSNAECFLRHFRAVQ